MISTKTDWLRLSFITAFIFVFKNRISSTFSRVTLPLFVSFILWETVIFCQAVLEGVQEITFWVQDILGLVHDITLVVQKISTVVPEINKGIHEIKPFDLHISPNILRKKSPDPPENKIPGSPDRFTLKYPARF